MKQTKSKKLQIGEKEYTPGAVDIGNSRIKVLINDNFFSSETTEEWKKSLGNFLKNFEKEDLFLCYSAVSTEILDDLKKICSSKNIVLKDITPLLKEQTFVLYDNIKGIGSDRLLGLYGAMKRIRYPLITVDCGTAITINAVDKSRKCLGGAIFAGVFTQFKALEQNAKNLFQVKMELPEKASGKNTTEALQSGVIISAAGAIKEITSKISDQEFGGRELPVVLCGGYSEMIFEILDDSIDLLYQIPNLVLEGIQFLMKDSRSKLTDD